MKRLFLVAALLLGGVAEAQTYQSNVAGRPVCFGLSGVRLLGDLAGQDALASEVHDIFISRLRLAGITNSCSAANPNTFVTSIVGYSSGGASFIHVSMEAFVRTNLPSLVVAESWMRFGVSRTDTLPNLTKRVSSTVMENFILDYTGR